MRHQHLALWRSASKWLTGGVALIALGFAGFWLSACSFAPAAPTPQPSVDKVVVYLLRDRLIAGSWFSTTFQVDGQPVVQLHDKEASWMYLPAGKHRFSAQFKRERLAFSSTLNAGETYHVVFGQEIIGKNRIRSFLQVAPPHEGKKRVEEYDYISPE